MIEFDRKRDAWYVLIVRQKNIAEASLVHNIFNLPMRRWERMGGHGCFIQLFGTEGKWGSYLIFIIIVFWCHGNMEDPDPRTLIVF